MNLESDQINYGKEMLQKEKFKDVPYIRGTCVLWKFTYGFIKADNMTENVFIDYREILTPSPYKILKKNDRVEFQVVKTEKGYKATNLSIVGG